MFASLGLSAERPPMLASEDEPKHGGATPNRVEAAKNDLARRTTNRIARSGFCPVPSALLFHHNRFRDPQGKRLNPSEVLLLIHLYSYKRGADHPYPGIDTLARRLGVTDRAVRKMLNRLEKCQLVRRIYDSRNRRSNRYDLAGLWRAIEDMLDADSQAALQKFAAAGRVAGGGA
jgi:DNA-binding MarR family transcriptional regulator